MADDLNHLKTDVEILKRDVTSINGFSAKIDDAIEKLAEVSNNISKMLIVHENRLENHDKLIDGLRESMSERKNDFEKQVDALHKRISDMKDENHAEREKHHKEIMLAIREVVDGQEKLESRIALLESWKWYVIGGATVVGVMLAQLPWDKLFGH